MGGRSRQAGEAFCVRWAQLLQEEGTVLPESFRGDRHAPCCPSSSPEPTLCSQQSEPVGINGGVAQPMSLSILLVSVRTQKGSWQDYGTQGLQPGLIMGHLHPNVTSEM